MDRYVPFPLNSKDPELDYGLKILLLLLCTHQFLIQCKSIKCPPSNQNVGKAMSLAVFVSNLDGMNEGENFSKDLLKVRGVLQIILNP